MIEKIEDNGEVLALIVRSTYNESGLTFLTERSNSFQVGFHNVEKGKRYRAHISRPFKKLEDFNPSKIYYVKKGKAGADIYNKDAQKVHYVTLEAGDLILFISGGHGLDVLENAEIIEIKQGPYRGNEEDKTFLE